jgi:hypothetical protein
LLQRVGGDHIPGMERPSGTCCSLNRWMQQPRRTLVMVTCRRGCVEGVR